MINTERFLLRPITVDDASNRYLQWVRNVEKNSYIEYVKNDRTIEDLKKYISSKISNKSVLFLGIFTKDELLHIGNIKYDPITYKKNATMGILIGDDNWKGIGVAPEVIRHSSRWMKKKYRVKNILLGVNVNNTRGIKAYKKIGFIDDGLIDKNTLSMILKL